jgi:hypothetical protein
VFVAPSAKRSRAFRPDSFARPLDHALERLRTHVLPYRAHAHRFDTWQAVCQSCLVADWTLTLRECGVGGELDVRCSAGCPEDEVRRALERHPADARVEAAEASAAESWAITARLRDVAGRALELAVEAQSELAQLQSSREAVPA